MDIEFIVLQQYFLTFCYNYGVRLGRKKIEPSAVWQLRFLLCVSELKDGLLNYIDTKEKKSFAVQQSR